MPQPAMYGPTLERIRGEFGDEVARIVATCSDTDVVPKPPWRDRKETYVAHLADADASTLRVSCADKLNNAARSSPPCTSTATTCGRALTPAMTRCSGTSARWPTPFSTHKGGPAAAELRRTVDELARVAARSGPGGGGGMQPPPPSEPTS